MERLYYKDQYIKEFTAEIVDIKEIDKRFHVQLDKTAFFPGGGGQFCDLGKIDTHDVVDVYEKGDSIYHVLETKPIKIHKVKCLIDWKRREDGMHQHFAQHVLSGCFFKTFNANTVSFHLGREFSTVDIHGYLEESQIRQVEILANNIINENIEAETLLPSKKELKKLGLRRDLPTTNQEIRVLKIGDLDINACCGVHPKSTLELRMIKIRRWEKNKGATRIEFLAGNRAIEYSLKRDLYLGGICRYLSCSEDEAIKGIQNLHNRLENTISSNRKLEETIANYEIKDMINNCNKISDISVVKKIYDNKNIKYVSKVATKITESSSTIALIGVKNEDKVNLVFAASSDLNYINMNNLLKDTITLVDGRGGGSNSLAQGGGKNNGNLDSAIDYAFMKIKNMI